jgi:PAS domain S-box-containing protein
LRWIFLCLVPIAPLAALNPECPADSYSIHGWFTEDGLHSNKIRAVIQTRDGYLWLATAQGLARFDGSQFTIFNGTTHPELGGGGFFAALEAPDGALWFGGDHGLFRWQNGRFDRFTTAEGLPHLYVRGLALTRDGGIVAFTRLGFSIVRDGRITTPGGIWKEVKGTARAYLEQADGTILLGTSSGLWRIADGKIAQLSGKAGLQGSAFLSLLESPDGSVWIGYSGGVHCLHPNGKTENYGPAQGLASPRVSALKLDRDGNLWIAGSGDLYRLSQGRIEPASYPAQLNGTPIQDIQEDREGGLWIATATGLFRLKDNIFSRISASEGLAHLSAYSVLEAADGAWWIGLWHGGVYRYDQKRAVRVPALAALDLDRIYSFATEPDGTLWIGSESGLHRYSGGRLTNLYRPDRAAAWTKLLAEQPDALLPGLAHVWVNAVATDGKGGIWAATEGALYRGFEGKFRAYTMLDGLPGDVCESVIGARNGDVWVTVPLDGVARWHEGKWTSYRCGGALSKSRALGVYEDSAGAIWVTTHGGGINRFKDGRWRTYTMRDGLPHNFTSSIVEDKLGNLWIGYPLGIMRIPSREFDEVEAGSRALLEPRIFNASDGLPRGDASPFGTPNVWRTRDGRLLFATDLGVAVIDPSKVGINDLKPPIHIERLAINGVDADISKPVSVAPGLNDLRIYYTAISLLAPEKVQFKIRLAPLDRDWVDHGTRRSIHYPKLPAGHYTFEVKACNNDGVWNEESATLAFTVRPFFYQTSWFISLVLIVVGLTVLGIYRARVRLARRQMAILSGLVAERTHELQGAKEWAELAVVAKNNSIDALQRAKEEVATERARFKFIFESVPVGIAVVLPREQGTLLVNPAHDRITGLTGTELQKPGAFDRVTHPDDLERQRPLLRKYKQGEIDRFTIEKRYLHPGGKIVWTKLTRRMFVDQATGVNQSITTLVDITDLKAAQEETARQQARLKFIFDAVPVGFTWMIRDNLASRIVNPAQARITGVPIEHSRELPRYMEATHPEDRARQHVLNQRLLAGEIDRYEIEKRYIHPNGVVCWAALTRRYYHDQANGEIQEITTLVDITERKAAEARLAETHKQLLTASRQAGMAEVATGVLHNVGNVLNSVNVSATLVMDRVRESKSANLPKLAAMLHAHDGDLANFLTSDPKGRRIPAYLTTLAGEIAAERETVNEELGHLRKNIEHIKDIVAMQQSYAKVSGVLEEVAVSELVEDSLRMNASALARHGLEIVREYGRELIMTVDRHKVLQVLVNLLRNAKYACDDSGRSDKQVTVRVTHHEHRVRIAVIDNGVGIAPENLTRIFAHGFTTRKEGHGFGLHSGALAAKELGGSLSVHSDGLGRGAAFTLELPFKPPAFS